jgi:hypothetical protein
VITIFDIPIKCTVKKNDEIIEGYLVCADEKGFTVVDEKGETIGVYKKEEIES